MVLVEAVGVLCVGIIVMYLTYFFVKHIGISSVQVLSAIMAVIFAGVVLQFILLADKVDFWYYPIGLVLGLFAFGVTERLGFVPKMLGFFGIKPKP
jgi:hypothetical protein